MHKQLDRSNAVPEAALYRQIDKTNRQNHWTGPMNGRASIFLAVPTDLSTDGQRLDQDMVIKGMNYSK